MPGSNRESSRPGPISGKRADTGRWSFCFVTCHRGLTIKFHSCNDCYMETRDRLLQDCLSYFLRHGVANLSLRPLAAAVGTSARMLLHYFGSKEALIAEVMEQVQQRLQNSFRELRESERN